MLEHPIRRLAHRGREIPTQLIVPLHEPQQVPPTRHAVALLLLGALKLLTRVQDAQVVQELHVASSKLESKSDLVGDPANYFERVFLVRGESAQCGVTRVAGRAQEGADAVVADDLASVLKEERAHKARVGGDEAVGVLESMKTPEGRGVR